ncbi:MAG: hypothetical protein PHF17_06180 [Arcobacteraceae bacterium]|nr:hypothetical protein [Arcobacteraceae bacterium]
MKKSLLVAGLLFVCTSGFSAQSYQTVGISISQGKGDIIDGTNTVSYSAHSTSLNYNLYNPAYNLMFSADVAPEQKIYSSTTQGHPYDYKTKGIEFSVSYMPKFYLQESLYVAPSFRLSRYKSDDYAQLTDGSTFSSTGTAQSETTKDTDTDLSVDVYLVNEYASYSNAFIGLSLVDDLLFKQSGDDERNNFALGLGIEHYLQNNFRISASFFNYLTDKKENGDYLATKNATSFSVGIDYKF